LDGWFSSFHHLGGVFHFCFHHCGFSFHHHVAFRCFHLWFFIFLLLFRHLFDMASVGEGIKNILVLGLTLKNCILLVNQVMVLFFIITRSLIRNLSLFCFHEFEGSLND
jgi:hypothetical protein